MTTAYDIAQRFVGVEEAPGHASNPLVLAMLQLDNKGIQGDEVPWCSAFVNFVAWLLRLPRSKSLAARSWLKVGTPVLPLSAAVVGFDIVVLKRGGGDQPGPEVTAAPGHVGFFSGYDQINGRVLVLGGNQGDEVSVATFPVANLLGIRRLA